MSTAVVESPLKQNGNKVLTIRDRLNQPAMIQELAKAMPKHCKPERMARVAMTALTRTPLLAECDQASFFQCLLSLSQWGLEPDGRRAHLIPFRNNKKNIIECQLIIDYKGYVELAYRSGIVKSIHADVVHRGDIFEYNLGHVRQHVPHFLRIDADKPKDAGEVFAAYCVVELLGGTVKTEILSKDQIEGIRRRSKAGSSGPWVTDWEEMAKKSAFRRASKWLPLSAEIADAFERDDDKLEEITVQGTAVRQIDDVTALLAGETPSEEDSQGAHDALNLDEAFAKYEAELSKAKTPIEAGAIRDRWIGPESDIPWPQEYISRGDEAFAKWKKGK